MARTARWVRNTAVLALFLFAVACTSVTSREYVARIDVKTDPVGARVSAADRVVGSGPLEVQQKYNVKRTSTNVLGPIFMGVGGGMGAAGAAAGLAADIPVLLYTMGGVGALYLLLGGIFTAAGVGEVKKSTYEPTHVDIKGEADGYNADSARVIFAPKDELDTARRMVTADNKRMFDPSIVAMLEMENSYKGKLASLDDDRAAISLSLKPAWYLAYGMRTQAEATATTSIPMLIRATGDVNTETRGLALTALADTASKPEAGAANLKKAMRAAEWSAQNDSDEGVKLAARAALQKLHAAELATGHMSQADESDEQASPERAVAAPASRATAPEPAPARAALPVAVASAPAQGPIVAVFDIEDSSKRFPKETLDQLTEYLAAQMSDVGYRVVPRDQVRERLAQEKTEGFKACYDQSCQIELGKEVAAEKSLSTKLLRVGKKCAISSVMYDLRTATTERSAPVDTACDEDALMDAMKQIAQKMSAH